MSVPFTKAVRTCLLFLLFLGASSTLKAQILSNTQHVPVINADNGPQNVEVKIFGGAAACNTALLEAILSSGYAYVSGSAVLIPYNAAEVAGTPVLVTAETISGTTITFQLPSIPAGNYVKVVYKITGYCGSASDVNINYTLNACDPPSSTEVVPININKAKLNIGIDPSTYQATSTGVTYSRQVSVANNGTGVIDTIYVDNIIGTGFTLGAFTVADINITTPGVTLINAQRTAISGGYRYRIVTSGFPINGALTITESVTINASTGLTSSYEAWYGTNLQKCTSYNGINTAGAVILTTPPNPAAAGLTYTTVTWPDMKCQSATGDYAVFRITNSNTTQIAYINYFYLYLNGASYNTANVGQRSYYLLNGADISTDNGGSWGAVNSVPRSGNYTYITNGTSHNTGQAIQLQAANGDNLTLAPGASMLIRFKVVNNPDAQNCSSNGASYWYWPRVQTNYNIAGVNGRTDDSNNSGTNYWQAYNGLDVSPPDVSGNQTYYINTLVNLRTVIASVTQHADNTGYIKLVYNLPAALTPSSNPADHSITSGSTTYTPDAIDITGNKLTLIFNNPGRFTGDVQWKTNIKTTFNCTLGQSVYSFNMEVYAKLAACADKEVKLLCAVPGTVDAHNCSTCNVIAATTSAASLERTTLGTPTGTGALQLQNFVYNDIGEFKLTGAVTGPTPGTTINYVFANIAPSITKNTDYIFPAGATATAIVTRGGNNYTITGIPLNGTALGTDKNTLRLHDGVMPAELGGSFQVGDAIQLKLPIQLISNTTQNFLIKGTFYAATVAAPADAEKVNCDPGYSAAGRKYAIDYTGVNTTNVTFSSCANVTAGVAGRWTLSHRVNGVANAAIFSNEYRTFFDLSAFNIRVPLNTDITALSIIIQNQGSSNITVNLPVGTPVISGSNKVYTFDIDNLHNIAPGLPGGNFNQGFILLVNPTYKVKCNNGNFTFNDANRLAYNYSHIVTPTVTTVNYGQTITSTNGIYTPLKFSVGTDTKVTTGNIVNWDFFISNDVNVAKNNVWIMPESLAGFSSVRLFEKGSGGSETEIVANANGVFALGSIGVYTNRSFRIQGTLSGCAAQQQLKLLSDFECAGYPASLTEAQAACRLTTTLLTAIPTPASLQTSIESQPSDPYQICNPMEFVVRVNNSSLNQINDIVVKASLNGVVYETGSLKVFYNNSPSLPPAASFTTPASFSVNNTGSNYTFTLPGTTISAGQFAWVKFAFRADNCNFSSGQRLKVHAEGRDACNNNILTNIVNSNKINIEGVPESLAAVTITSSVTAITEATGGSLEIGTYTLKVTNTGSLPILPADGYGFSSELLTGWTMAPGAVVYTSGGGYTTASYTGINSTTGAYEFALSNGLAQGESVEIKVPLTLSKEKRAEQGCNAVFQTDEIVYAKFTPVGNCGITCTINHVISEKNDLNAALPLLAPVITGTLNLLIIPGCGAADAPAVTTVAALELWGVSITDIYNSDNELSVTHTDGTISTGCNKTFVRTYTITNKCNAKTNIQQTITVEDKTAPTGTAPAGLSDINACYVNANTLPSGVPTFNSAGVALNYSDNCGGAVTAELTGTSIVGTNCSWTVTYTYKVKDACNNELTGQTIIYTGGDKTTPAITCPANITTSGIQSCSGSVAIPALVYSDNCGNTNLTLEWQMTGATVASGTGQIGTYTFAEGVTTIKYKVTDFCNNITECSFTVSRTVLLPNVSITGLAAAYCKNATAVTLTGSPSGGTFTIDGTPASQFNPAAFNSGEHTVIYDYTDENGCRNTATQKVTVHSLPVITTDTYGPVCIDAADITLAGSPAGGTWSGTGVSGNTGSGFVFDPSAGTQTLTYTYTDGNSCSNSATTTITVNALPVITTGAYGPVCIDGVDITLSGSPAGGTWSGTGVSGNAGSGFVFDPSAGTQTLTYTYANGNNCSNSAATTITVNALPVITTGSYGPVCIDGADITLAGSPAGGTWSGTGVSGSTGSGFVFDPSAGTQTLTYTYIDGNNCSNSATTTITVNTLPVITTGSYGPVCIDGADITLSGSPAGGTWSGTGVSGSIGSGFVFDPTAGTQTLTYTYTGGNNCSNSATTTITVNALPGVTAGSYAPVCIDGAAITLSGTPVSGGTWSGSGVSGNSFNPATAGAGDHVITYTYTNGNNCSNSATTTIKVNNLPSVNITGLAPGYCKNSTAVVLTGTPAGGTFTIDGNAATEFNPGQLTAGAHTVVYVFTDGNGCSGSATQQVIISNQPILSINGLADAYCINASKITLSGNPSGGTFTVNGTTATEFDPSVLGTGNHTVEYFYTDGNNCSNSAATTTTVNALPVITTGTYGPVCIDGAAITLRGTPTGGTWSGTGVSGNSFSPATAGAGDHVITYSYTDGNNCSNSATTTIVVNALPVVRTGSYGPVCIDGAAIMLSGTPAGGTWSGTGVSGNSFNPATTGACDHVITYSYTDGNNCSNSATTTIVVNALPVVRTGSYGPVCIDGAAIMLSGTPSGGTWSGTGVNGNSFNPAMAGAGDHVITYTYTDGNNCSNSAATTIVVNALPTINGTLTLCEGASTTLTGSGSPAANNPWISSNTLIATVSNSGVVTGQSAGTATITYTDANGCDNTATITVTPATRITAQPLGATYCRYERPVALRVNASGTATLTYQWYSNTNNSTSGGTLVGSGTTYTPLTATVGTLYYYAVVTGNCGTATSDVAAITIMGLPEVITHPQQSCPGTTIDLTAPAVTAGSTTGLIFRYYTNADGTEQVGNPAAVTQSGTYYIVGIAGTGCSDTTAVTIMFKDDEAPVLTGTLPLNQTGINSCGPVSGPSAEAVYSLYTDNCSQVLRATKDSSTVFTGCNWATTFTYIVFDEYGNRTAPVTIMYSGSDQSAPVLTAPMDANYSCGELVPAMLPLPAADNCDVSPKVTMSEVKTTDNGPNDYVLVRTWTATDLCGNDTTVQQTITVKDVAAPRIISCANPKTTFADGNCGAAVPAFTGDIRLTDDCKEFTPVTITQSPAAGTVLGTGVHTITITATDGSGNSSSCTTTFTVKDITPPVITACAALQVQEVSSNGCSGVVPDYRNSITVQDNCTSRDQLTITQHPAAGTVLGIGIHGITITVTDASGNSSFCTATLEIKDTQKPTISCGNDVSSAINAPVCKAIVPLPVPTINDNCGVSILTWVMTGATTGQSGANGINYLSQNTLFNAGVTTVTYTVYDRSGNSSSCSFRVTVAAGTLAVTASGSATCAGGQGTITVTGSGGKIPYQYSIDGGSYQSSNTFTAAIGQHSITIMDANGCIATATATIGMGSNVTATTTTSHVSCTNTTLGSITITAGGGTEPYQYSSNNGNSYQSSNVFSNLSAGQYAIKVKDVNGCTATLIATVQSGSTVRLIELSAHTIQPKCNETTGSITTAARFSGGAGQLTISYNWYKDGVFYSGNPNLLNVPAGNYRLEVAVTDEGSPCVNRYSTSTSILTGGGFTGTVTGSTAVTCNSTPIPVITFSATGGTAPYTYTYSLNGGAEQTISGGSPVTIPQPTGVAGTYNYRLISVSDAGGCIQTITNTSATVVVSCGTAPIDTVPDVSPVITILPAIAHGPSLHMAVIDVHEVNGVNTSGPITVYVSKDDKISMNGWQSSATTMGNFPVNNSAWVLDAASNNSFYIFTTVQVIPGFSKLSFGYPFTLTPGQRRGHLQVTATIKYPSGGENRVSNNVDAEGMDYFIN